MGSAVSRLLGVLVAAVLLLPLGVVTGHLRPGPRIVATVMAAVLASAVVSVSVHAQSPSPGPALSDPEPGTAWQRATVDGQVEAPFRTVVRWRGGFAAIGWPDKAYTKKQGLDVPVWLSTDGSEWTPAPSIELPSKRADVTHLAAVQGGIMAFGSQGTRLLVWSSIDGRRWRRENDPTHAAVGLPPAIPYGLAVEGAVAGHGWIVVSGSYATPGDNTIYSRVWTSSDWHTWHSAIPRMPYQNIVNSLGVGPRGYFGLKPTNRQPKGCDDGAPVPVSSSDGLDWRVVPRSRAICGAHSLAFDKTMAAYFVSTWSSEDEPSRVLRSRNRKRWHEVFTGPTEIDGRRWDMGAGTVLAQDGVIAIVGEGDVYLVEEDHDVSVPWLLISDNGRTWRFDVAWPGPDEQSGVSSAALGHDRLVVVAGNRAWYANVSDLLERLDETDAVASPAPSGPPSADPAPTE